MRKKKSDDRWLLVLTLHHHSHNCHEKEEEWWQVITCKQLSWHFITILITVMRIVKQDTSSKRWRVRWLLILTLHHHSHNCHESVTSKKKSGDTCNQVITCKHSFYHFITLFITVMTYPKPYPSPHHLSPLFHSPLPHLKTSWFKPKLYFITNGSFHLWYSWHRRLSPH
jgi:hypothetical protein